MVLDVDQLPPVVNSVIDGYRAPHYALGWVIPVDEAKELFGETPEDRRTLNYYNTVVLAEGWRNVKEKDLYVTKTSNLTGEFVTTSSLQKLSSTHCNNLGL